MLPPQFPEDVRPFPRTATAQPATAAKAADKGIPVREADREKVVTNEPAPRHQCLHVLTERLLSVPRSDVLNTTRLFLAEQLKSAFNSKPRKNKTNT